MKDARPTCLAVYNESECDVVHDSICPARPTQLPK